MDTKKVSYFSDFLACPLAALAVGYLTLHKAPNFRAGIFLLSILGGLAAWTLIEYVVHRLVYHHAPIIRDLHELHHRDPSSYEGTPPLLSVLLIAAGVYAPLYGLGANVAGGATVGMLTGYVIYMSVHHAVHHIPPRSGSLLYFLWKMHARHHYARSHGNYGVTSPVWDKVFRTELDR